MSGPSAIPVGADPYGPAALTAFERALAERARQQVDYRIEVPELAGLVGDGPLVFTLRPRTLQDLIDYERAAMDDTSVALAMFVAEHARLEDGSRLFSDGGSERLLKADSVVGVPLLEAVSRAFTVQRSQAREAAEGKSRPAGSNTHASSSPSGSASDPRP